jgi:ribonuclease P protein subunit POP4
MATPTPHPAEALLLRAHSPETTTRIFADKIRNKPLLLNPTASTDRDKRALRRHVRLRKKEYFSRKRKPQPLSAKEKRQLGVFKLNKQEIKYSIYQQLHEMWIQYMLQVLGYVKDGNAAPAAMNRPVTANGHGSLLASADFHGAEVEVVRSSDTGKVGLKGIVVRDTQYTFVIITKKDEVKTVPKRNTVFRYEIPLPGIPEEVPKDDHPKGEETERKLVFELHGNQFEFRPADRANRKFKWQVTDYL